MRATRSLRITCGHTTGPRRGSEGIPNTLLARTNALDFSTLNGFRTLINELNAASGERPLRSMINRLMSRASFSVKPAPHMGMALPVYTNGTSPLRKALDFCVHLQVKAMLATQVSRQRPPLYSTLSIRPVLNRQAVTAANNWLSCNFQTPVTMDVYHDAQIVHINTSASRSS